MSDSMDKLTPGMLRDLAYFASLHNLHGLAASFREEAARREAEAKPEGGGRCRSRASRADTRTTTSRCWKKPSRQEATVADELYLFEQGTGDDGTAEEYAIPVGFTLNDVRRLAHEFREYMRTHGPIEHPGALSALAPFRALLEGGDRG